METIRCDKTAEETKRIAEEIHMESCEYTMLLEKINRLEKEVRELRAAIRYSSDPYIT